MLDARYLRENFEKVRERLLKRGDIPGLERFSELDVKLRDILREVEALKNKKKRSFGGDREVKEGRHCPGYLGCQSGRDERGFCRHQKAG